MEEKEKEKEKLRKAMKDFKDSAYRLQDVWNESEGKEPILTENYPFKDSFDEVVCQISEWVKEHNGEQQ